MKFKKYFMYPFAYLGISIVMQSLVSWFSYYYAPPVDNPYGLVPLTSIALVGIAMAIGRVIDAISDPLIAYWSDNCKSKLGRRKPFLIFGAFPLTLSYILIWFPPMAYESVINGIYLTIILSLYFIFFTVYVAPYLALLPEIGKGTLERATISTYQSVYNTIGLLIQGIMAPILIDIYGVKAMGIMLGLASLFTFVMPFVIKEDNIEKADTQFSLKQSIKLTWDNLDYRHYIISIMFLWFGINMLTIAMPYIATVLMKLEGFEIALLQGILFVNAIIISPIMLYWIKRHGKKKVYLVSMNILRGILLFMFFIGKPYLFFDSKLYGFILFALAGFPLSSMFIIPNAMIADLTDIDEIKHGQRREAMFYGIQGFILKAVIGLSSFFTSGLLFRFLGYNPGNSLGIELTGPIAAACLYIGMFSLKKYSINEEILKEQYESYKGRN